MLKVRFKADRGFKDEEVDSIDAEQVGSLQSRCSLSLRRCAWQLKAVWEHVLSTGGDGALEHLKPFKMALVSPRCFWSMIQ